MGGKRSQWARRYRQFVEAGLAEDDEEFAIAMKQSPRSIGSDSFRVMIDEMHRKRAKGYKSGEDVALRRMTDSLAASVVMDALAEALDADNDAFLQRRRNSPLRAVASRMLIRFGGMSQRDVACHLKMGTGGAVSAQIKRLPGILADDKQLRRKVEKLEKQLAILMREKGGE